MRIEASDQQLIDKARLGDATSFRLLVEKYQRRVFSVAFGLVRNREDALDICQEVFLRVHRNLATFDGESQFFTWLYRIVYNLCIDHHRRTRLNVVGLDEVSEPVAEEAEADPLRNLDSEDIRERLLEAMATLSPAHRAVLTLREVQGLSYKEIATTVGCSIGTVMSRLFHARKRLQRALQADPDAVALAA